MAKKPSSIDEEDDFDEDLFGDDSTDEYPSLEGTSSNDAANSVYGADVSEPDEEEAFEFELEDLEVKKDYKHLKLEVKEGLNENDYVLFVEGQSHGFCNLLVKHLLTIDGVVSSAYRVTIIKPPEVFIRLQNGINVKDILFKAIDALKKDVSELEKLFSKLM